MECGCSSKGLMPVEKAHELIESIITKIESTESVSLQEAVDRVLAVDIASPLNVPSYDNSAMDGYAINVDDLQNFDSLKLIGKSFAGHSFEGSMRSGECIRIMTGAQIPEGANAVIMQENVEANDTSIKILKSQGAGEAIRPAGDDIQKGQIVLKKGYKVTPISIGVLASLGIAKVEVLTRLKVAVFSTGDELLEIGTPHQAGKIYDTNRPMLVAMLQRLGFEVLDFGIIEDDKEKIRNAFEKADLDADCVITSGGVSVGEADYTREVLDEIGDIDFWKLAIKPGKPLAFGRLPNSFFFGLPGNPVSSAVTFDQIAVLALRAMSGEEVKSPIMIKATASTSFKKKPGRKDFQRALLTKDKNGELHVSSARTQSSGVLSGFVENNSYVVLDLNRETVDKGELVEVLQYDRPFL